MMKIKHIKQTNALTNQVISEKKNKIIMVNNQPLLRTDYEKNEDGLEKWFTYDNLGNKILEKWSNGFEETQHFDERGNRIHLKKSNNYEEWAIYNDNNQLIERKYFITGEEFFDFFEYDDQNRLLKEDNRYQTLIFSYNTSNEPSSIQTVDKESLETERKWFTYNENNLLIETKNSNNDVQNYVYDNRGNLLKYTTSYGSIDVYEYDENNNEIYFKSYDNDVEEWRTYNQNNELIHFKNNFNDETWMEYDQKGNHILTKNSDGLWISMKYNENNDLIYFESNEGMKE